MIQFDSYFSDGLVQPPTSLFMLIVVGLLKSGISSFFFFGVTGLEIRWLVWFEAESSSEADLGQG